MKKYLVLALAVAIALIIFPLGMYNRGVNAGQKQTLNDTTEKLQAEHTTEKNSQKSSDENISSNSSNEVIDVFISSDKSVQQMQLRDYIVGVVAAEMPAAYEIEALKAQAAASVTLARYMKKNNSDDASLNGAVISTDSKKHQAYMSIESMKERFGDSFDLYYNKLCDAVDTVINCEISYKGEPILAAFHAISSGKTENSADVWNKGEDYLISVESEGDKLSPKFATSLTVSSEEFGNALKNFSGEYPQGDTSEWIKDSSYTDSGTLRSIIIGDRQYTGSELREIFSLRSSAITISYNDGNFVLDVTGYGHGVGMSQYGADYYARQGMTWEQIIEHYYPGTEIIYL